MSSICHAFPSRMQVSFIRFSSNLLSISSFTLFLGHAAPFLPCLSLRTKPKLTNSLQSFSQFSNTYALLCSTLVLFYRNNERKGQCNCHFIAFFLLKASNTSLLVCYKSNKKKKITSKIKSNEEGAIVLPGQSRRG